jgi:mycothiol maleylpyruvate isomerase-like protein
MRSPEPILVAPLFGPLNDELVILLRGLTPDEWNARAVGTWTVKDVAAHLLDTTLRRLSAQRDHYSNALSMTHGLAALINELNAQWVSATRRVSPQILTEMLDQYGRAYAEHVVTLAPYAPSIGVSWAGEETSANWFDVARELTEKWHHQQQIRDAAARPPLYDLRYFKPVIETFMRGLPHAYRSAVAPDGASIEVGVRGVAICSLVRDAGKWLLDQDSIDHPTTTVRMTGDTAWRLFTKGFARDEARKRSEVTGDTTLAEPLFSMLAIVA